MSVYQILIAAVYTSIVLSLIWARFRFFKITSTKSKLVSYLNDPAVVVQIVFTYKCLLLEEYVGLIQTAFMIPCYCCGFLLFWWAIRSSEGLGFASEETHGDVITTGAFEMVRHPFYLSYLLVWVTSTVFLNSIYLWLSLSVLIVLYLIAARAEEASILKGVRAVEYSDYKARVNMFLPRISLFIKA